MIRPGPEDAERREARRLVCGVLGHPRLPLAYLRAAYAVLRRRAWQDHDPILAGIIQDVERQVEAEATP